MNTKSARELRKNLTDAERRLWQKLKRRKIATVKFRRQQPIGPFIVDFVCFERRVIVEVDGGQHAEQASYDEQRTCWLEAPRLPFRGILKQARLTEEEFKQL